MQCFKNLLKKTKNMLKNKELIKINKQKISYNRLKLIATKNHKKIDYSKFILVLI